MALIAQLTDPHLRDDGADPFHDPAAALRQAFVQIAAMDPMPDAIVLTGDIVDRNAAGYGHALPILRSAPVPVLPLPGNHDDPARFRAAFHGWGAFAPDHLSFTARIADLDLVALDSTLPDGRPGIDAQRLDWLADVLANLQRRAVLALHHPPFATLTPHLDKSGFRNADALAGLVRRSTVSRIIAGHSHRAMQTVWAGCLASTAPAIGHGLSLSLSGAESHKPIAMTPAFELHVVDQENMISHQIPLI
ncbi:metallophosphoesterase [Roseinatronobacter sp.]|uniref:metallophosphoesterase n=1 Tax=Roseinatronobacter sp. TaxID=1945755 RepID=UPI003F728340